MAKTKTQSIVDVYNDTQLFKDKIGLTSINNAITELYNPIKDISNSIYGVYSPIREMLQQQEKLKECVNKALKEYDRQEKELQKYPLYNEIIEELALKKRELIEVKTELEGLKAGFRKFYENAQPKYNEDIKPIVKKYYSLNCEFSEFKIKTILFPIFNLFFECSESDLINFLSENITVQLIVKDDVFIKDIVYLLDFLNDQKIIKTKQYANVIVKTESIIFEGKPLNSDQFKNAKKTLKTSLPSENLETVLQQNIK